MLKHIISNLIILFWFSSILFSECIEGDCKNGYGVWEAVPHDGYKYYGQWKNGNYHGYGIVFFADGFSYIGEWEEGNRHGIGTLISPNYRYTGEWVNDSEYGKGFLIYPSGKKYIGDFKNDEYDGYGILYNPDGSIKQKGFWKKGKFIGKKRKE
jgi:hypothetical protein